MWRDECVYIVNLVIQTTIHIKTECFLEKHKTKNTGFTAKAYVDVVKVYRAKRMIITELGMRVQRG